MPTTDKESGTIGPHLLKILTEMCNRVGADVNEVDFHANDWFWQYTWAGSQQDDFISWLINYLKTNREARKEICRRPSMRSKAHLTMVAESFVFNWGWKIDDD